ncbi:unnamed protein product, partial [Callosobruchus maculatus]
MKKAVGTKKINSSCTSRIKLTMKQDSSVLMNFVKMNYGHDFEIQHLRIPKEERVNIARKLTAGVNAISVDMYVKECFKSKSNPVLYYKPQNIEDNNNTTQYIWR